MRKKSIIIEGGLEYEVFHNDSYSETWYLGSSGKIHRVSGPAVILPNGRQEWYLHGEYHREGGPAITCPNGSQQWYQHGKLHRLDGPADINKTMSTMSWWYVNGECVALSQQEFDRWLKMRSFL